ncbi:complex I NDUFA9 subunit family protein [Anaplasma phagocytophilum]|uniref:Saccharopine dehydrogenase family protein n=2 Tax=Anaplasma phagocytophilum TaxID=948 RepID=A0A0F3PKH4_ANAPH|nr:complex I NDUFA9 subunit family protein [Anaplasma phagocytophilum]EOA62731.1 NADH-ubiquinone oxidoreductase family protein [Anaplasma phagocytophilum str. CRT38]KDB55766.1 NADH-ubiquinone oxidoreductase [Anaplasma phagocytophilum str. CRT35]KJV80788.1 saccharopine dehydrogenase family protein [Anaplasma phagocytophilum str. CRT53-1]
MKKVLVFGGSGFIGRYLVCELVARKYSVTVYTRNHEKAARLKLFGRLGQVDIVCGKLSDAALIQKLIADCDVIVNLVGTISDPRSAVLQYLHVTFPSNIATLATKHGKMFVHFSAMGADIAKTSSYAQSKLEGEKRIRDVCENAVILRPNLVFGDGDNFFNKFANLARVAPFMPLFGGGKNLLQPVHVDDVVNVAMDLIVNQASSGTYEVAGPTVYSLRDLIKFVLVATGRKKPMLSIPSKMAKFIAYICEIKIVSFILQPATGSSEPIVTRDQVELMKYDIILQDSSNVRKGKTTIEEIVPEYLKIYEKASN